MAKITKDKAITLKAYNGTGGTFSLKVYAIENSVNIEDNTSNITVKATLSCGTGSFSGGSAGLLQIAWTDNVNKNSTYSDSVEISKLMSGSKSVSITFNIPHDTNTGEITGIITASWDRGSNGYQPKDGEVEVSMALTTIPRSSTLIVEDGERDRLGVLQSIKLTIDKKVDSYVHTLNVARTLTGYEHNFNIYPTKDIIELCFDSEYYRERIDAVSDDSLVEYILVSAAAGMENNWQYPLIGSEVMKDLANLPITFTLYTYSDEEKTNQIGFGNEIIHDYSFLYPIADLTFDLWSDGITKTLTKQNTGSIFINNFSIPGCRMSIKEDYRSINGIAGSKIVEYIISNGIETAILKRMQKNEETGEWELLFTEDDENQWRFLYSAFPKIDNSRLTYTFQVKDNRGLLSSLDYEDPNPIISRAVKTIGKNIDGEYYPLINYEAPTLNLITELKRPESTVSYAEGSFSGTYYDGVFSELDNAVNNSLTFEYGIVNREGEAPSEWFSLGSEEGILIGLLSKTTFTHNLKRVVDENTQVVSGDFIDGLNKTSSTFVVIKATDATGSYAIQTIEIPKAVHLIEHGDEYYNINGELNMRGDRVPRFVNVDDPAGDDVPAGTIEYSAWKTPTLDETLTEEEKNTLLNSSYGIQMYDYKGKPIYPTMPIGTVHCSGEKDASGEPVSPAKYFGGTWELIDKEFISLYGNMTDWFERNTTNVTSVDWCAIVRGGHSVRMRLTLENKVAFNDDTFVLGTLNLADLGVSSLLYTQAVVGTVNDTSILRASINNSTGVVSNVSVIGGTTVNASSTCTYEFHFVFSANAMLNSACNKFYWQRVA